MSPIVTQVHDTRSISPANCCPFANFWSTVLSPETWNRAPPSHLKVWPASLSWYRPHFNILSHKHWDQQIYNWPFSSNNAFGTLFTHVVVGCKTTPWNMAIIHHCWSFPSYLQFAFVYIQTLAPHHRPTGLSMATFGKLPLPSSSLCPAHPPPRSGWCRLSAGFSSHKLLYSCTLLVFLLPFPLQSSFFSL